jgi:hypothetical protein
MHGPATGATFEGQAERKWHCFLFGVSLKVHISHFALPVQFAQQAAEDAQSKIRNSSCCFQHVLLRELQSHKTDTTQQMSATQIRAIFAYFGLL